MIKISTIPHAFRDGFRSGRASVINTTGISYLTRVRNAGVVWDRWAELAVWRCGYGTAVFIHGGWE